jgi:hypothetical protein
MNNIEWDKTIKLSNEKYLSSEISTTTKGEIKNGEFIEYNLTAKEWIIYEIERCKIELEDNKKAISSKKELEKNIKEITLLNKYFEKHITNYDILFSLHIMGNEDYNQLLDNNYNNIKELIKTKLTNSTEKLNKIKNQQRDIIRICLENIKLILIKENKKNYLEIADTLLKMNDITLGKNHKQITHTTETYTQNNIELYLKKLTK